ncbi:MAG TPA: PLAT/LH2 domain-containing protein [Thermoanaerobaculia bacterium]|nr:PLAT/LH2 domain-containing protein [Thermoanaerobaculia bacterium]
MNHPRRHKTAGLLGKDHCCKVLLAGLWLLGLLGAGLPAAAQTSDPKAACKVMVNCAVGTALGRLPLATPCNGTSLCTFLSDPANEKIVSSWFESGGACNAAASAVQGFNPQQLLLEAVGCVASAAAGQEVQKVLCTLSPEAFFSEAVSWVICDFTGAAVEIVGEIGQVIATLGGEGSVVYERGEKKVIVSSLGVTKAFKTSDGCGWIADCETCSQTINVAAAGNGRHCLWAWDGRVHSLGNDVFVPLARCAEGEPFLPKGRLDGRVVVVKETRVGRDEDELLPSISLNTTCDGFQKIALASIALIRGEACSDTFTAPAIEIAELPESLRQLIPPDIKIDRVQLGVPFKPCPEGMVCANATQRRVKLFPVDLPDLDLRIERDLEVGSCSELRELQESCNESFTVCREGLLCREGRCVSSVADYEVAFTTGARIGAGTDARIDVFLEGEEGSTVVIPVNQLIQGNAFERGRTDVARLQSVRNVGKLTKIGIIHHNIPGGVLRDPWTLDSVMVRQDGRTVAAASCDCALEDGSKTLDLVTDYDLVFTTADAAGSGTDADITVQLEGLGGLKTEPIRVNQLIRGNAFERGTREQVRLAAARNVGRLTKIHIVHHNLLGFPDAWTLASVSAQQQGRAFFADCNCTLNSGMKSLDLKPTTR